MPRAVARHTSAPTASTGSTMPIRSHVAPPTPPICQKRNVSMASTRGSSTALTSDANAAVAAAPASASLSGVAPPRPSEPTA